MLMIDKAKEAWDEPPLWVLMLAQHADRYGARQTGDIIGLSRTTISLTINNKYQRGLATVKSRTEFFLMRHECPLINEAITSEKCTFNKTREFNQSTCAECPHFKEV